jgi:two-component system, NtrC family, response regulator HydG
VRATDLDVHELLHFAEEGGIITFAGERVLLLDAVALGLLRKELIDTLGLTAARAVLTRFGYAHGWRVAETLRTGFPWDSEDEWRAAGARLHTIQGIVRAEVTRTSVSSAAPGAEGIWHDSYEAEQHLLHLGQAEEPICWTLTGFASGYMSCVYGKEIIAIEDRCRGKGDAICRAVVRSKDEWGPELATHLPFYQKEACLDARLAQLTDTLKKKERQLQSRRALRQSDPHLPAGLVGSSPAMLRTLDLARRVAKVDSTILITGESGVGKERLARFIHDESARTAGPFLAINCAAVPETLLESELFGHARGSFTGASQDRPGLFEAANGGTLLLDEIGDMELALQARLLRVLEDGSVRRIGETQERHVDVRVVAATHCDLEQAVSAGRFRRDLYFRLAHVPLQVPALRDHVEDVPELFRHFLALFSARHRLRTKEVREEVLAALQAYAWPGNVRELRNLCERLVLLGNDPLTLQDLPADVLRGTAADETGWVRPARLLEECGVVPFRRFKAECEREYLEAVLQRTRWNFSAAARALGLHRTHLHAKAVELGLTRPGQGSEGGAGTAALPDPAQGRPGDPPHASTPAGPSSP